MIENIHHGAYLAQSQLIGQLNAGAVEKLETICRRGKEDGTFHPEITPLELHWQISALSFFNVSNRPTFSSIFGAGLFSGKGQETLRSHVVDMVLRFAVKPGHGA